MKDKTPELIYRLGRASLLMAVVFYVLHWPYLLPLAIFALILLCVAHLLYIKDERFDKSHHQLSSLFAGLAGVALLTSLLGVFPSEIANPTAVIFIVIWHLLNRFFESGRAFSNYIVSSSSRLIRAIGSIGTGVLLIGILFRVQHWPFASLLILCGGLLASVALLLPIAGILHEKSSDYIELDQDL